MLWNGHSFIRLDAARPRHAVSLAKRTAACSRGVGGGESGPDWHAAAAVIERAYRINVAVLYAISHYGPSLLTGANERRRILSGL